MATAQRDTLLRHIHRLAAGPRVARGTDRQLLDDFRARRDEAAFAALLARHGPMVLRVCRRVLNHEHDAEDAFQATFLVLARNTAAIRRHEALAGWLHGVAYRTAMKAKRSAARRRNHEGRVCPAASQAPAGPTWDEVQGVLDEEIRLLPEHYRTTFTLCVLESKSVPAAAAELGCKVGTVSSWLTRARQRLQQRLARRGIKLAALLAALSVGESARADLPAGLAQATIGFGLSVAAGEPAATIPSHVAALAAGVTRAMFLSKAKIATALLIALGLAVAGAGALSRPAPAAPPEEEKPAAAKPAAEVKPTPAGEKDGPLEVRGRVLDPDGKPAAGARLIFVYSSSRKVPEKVWATSGADGRFEFSVAREALSDRWYEENRDRTYVVAAAEGYGAAAARLPAGAGGDVTLRLAKDDVPLRGRILDLQGKPVAGATVRIDDVLYFPKKDDLTGWLEALKAGKENPGLVDVAHLTGYWSPAFAALFPPVTTGADGRFEIKGIGRERLVNLRIEGPTIVTRQVRAMTRRGDMIRVPEEIGRNDVRIFTYCGTGFELVVPPTKPVVGVVRDKDTGKPLVGVTVRTHIVSGTNFLDENLIRVTTDKDGRYRIVGLPKGPGNQIAVTSADLPYLPAVETVPDTPGLEPVTFDFALKRGVWVKGRVTDKATGEPVAAGVKYFTLLDNPHAKEVSLDDSNSRFTKEDGSFRAIALPGPGVITVRAHHDRYRMGVGADRIEGHRDENVDMILARPHLIDPRNYHVLVPIDPASDAESVTCDVALDPGRTVKGVVVGPDGQPLAGARVSGQKAMNYWDREPLKGAEFTILSLGDDESRLIQVMHEGKRLAGSLVARGTDKGPVRVALQPWGSVTGRLVTPDGEPLPGVQVSAFASAKKGETTKFGFLPGRVSPGKDGKFRLDGLAPGLAYNLGVSKGYYGLETEGPELKGLTIKPGETKDLGDIRVKPMP
jgi:RNA polymerase sigma factor (sigma-70 family)